MKKKEAREILGVQESDDEAVIKKALPLFDKIIIAIGENSQKDENGNAILGDAFQISSKNCLINSNSRLTVGLGLESIVIIETNDSVLVAKKAHLRK